MNEFKQIAVNSSWKDRFHDGLKKIKENVCKERIDITFQQVTMAKSIGAWTMSFLATLKDSPRFPATAQNCSTSLELIGNDSSIRTHKVLVNVNVGKNVIVTKPQLPVELFNALVTARGNFVNGCESL
jgi:hypothetical protein